MVDSTHLDNHHRRTAQAILSHPVSHNIEWRDVLSLLEAIGEVSEEDNGKFKVAIGGETETLHRPSGKDIDAQMVVDLRRMLGAAGITAEGLHERLGVSAKPAAVAPRGHAILVINAHGAKRIVGLIETDDEDLTEPKILAQARAFYGDDSPRDHGDGRWGEN